MRTTARTIVGRGLQGALWEEVGRQASEDSELDAQLNLWSLQVRAGLYLQQKGTY